MDPGGPSRPAPFYAPFYAGGPAAHGGEAPSSSSPRPPPPPQPQQGHAIQPAPLRQTSRPWDLGAGALPTGFRTPPLHPQFGASSSGRYLSMPVEAGTAARNFERNPRDIPCSLGPSIRPSPWTPSNSDMVAVPQQRYAPQNWPPPSPPPQFVQHPPRFEPLPPQPWGAPEPPIYQDPRVQETKLVLLNSPMVLGQLVMSPEHSAILVHQLEVGDEQMRDMVLDGFKHCGREIMGDTQGHAVLEALLHSLHGRYRGLEIIVEVAIKPRLLSRSKDGVYSLELLITAVAGFPALSARLVHSFVNERVMDDVGGDELIVRCFTTMPDYVTAVLINHAIDTIDDKMLCPFGSTFLATCFEYAEGEEVPRFQTIILAKAVEMAKKRAGKHFLLHLLNHANVSIQFRKQLMSKLMKKVLDLCFHCQGQIVVEQCFVSKETELLNIALRACADLTTGELQVLLGERVVSRSFVLLLLHRLVEDGNTPFPEIAKDLARKIEELPPHIRKHDDVKLLMSAIRRVLARR
uniref:PUM-HD domain-containing protein n=1 Tax=Hordeum vulgare subsp. vulgare TaxID=112509 RepID=A0A8I6XSX8_HORVV